jgi:chemotaxis protein CheD
MQFQTIQVLGGDYNISNRRDVVFATALGSCVAACISDPVSGIGGMNHFLLPAEGVALSSGPRERYGVHAMRALVSDLCRLGADRNRLQAKLFGGAGQHGRRCIGEQNIDFARKYLSEHDIELVGGSLGGDTARWVRYHPLTGRSSFRAVPAHPANAVLAHAVPETETGAMTAPGPRF